MGTGRPSTWRPSTRSGYAEHSMKHTVPHDLPFDLAKKAADAALQSYRTRFPDYDPQVTWADDKTANVALKAKGMSLKGVFEINPDHIAMDMEVPLLLRPFKQ